MGTCPLALAPGSSGLGYGPRRDRGRSGLGAQPSHLDRGGRLPLLTAGFIFLLAWQLMMAGLGGVMFLEKTSVPGKQLVPAIGVTMLAWGSLVAVHPTWLPPMLAGAA